jgi:hypothetical protein
MVNALSHDVPPGIRVRASALVVVPIQLLGIASALAVPGDLDLTFGDAGRVFIDLGDQPSYAFRLVQQADSKLVLASTIYDTNSAQRFLARLELDGTRIRSTSRTTSAGSATRSRSPGTACRWT